jgi:Alpha-2,8-polysialyltransferase (POLYST)
MQRLVFAHGPWQLLIAASAMKQASSSWTDSQDVLVILDRGAWSSDRLGPLEPGGFCRVVRDSGTATGSQEAFPSRIGEIMHRIALAVWPWSRIIVLNIDDNDTWRNLLDCRRPVQILRSNLGLSEPDELWCDCLGGVELDPHRVVYRVTAEAFPTARLVLYEDGLDSYIPLEDYHFSLRYLSRPRLGLRALKAGIRNLRAPHDVSLGQLLPRHLRRVVASYLWVSLLLPPPPYQKRLPWVQLQTRFLKETIERISPIVEQIDLKGFTAQGRRAILLGQCFAAWGQLDRDVELDCYIDMTRRLEQMGYEVMWKEHPRRARDPLLPELARAVPGIQTVPDLGPWPIELFVRRLGITACASLTSTTLVSLPLLHGMPSFSMAARYTSMLPYPHNELARIVAKAIPQLDEIDTRVSGRQMNPLAAGDAPEPTSVNIASPVESVH